MPGRPEPARQMITWSLRGARGSGRQRRLRHGSAQRVCRIGWPRCGTVSGGRSPVPPRSDRAGGRDRRRTVGNRGAPTSSVGRPVSALGDRGGDVPAPQQATDRPAGTGLVAQHPLRRGRRAAPNGPQNTDHVGKRRRTRWCRRHSPGEHGRQRQPAAIDSEADPGGRPPTDRPRTWRACEQDRIAQSAPVCVPSLPTPGAYWWAPLTVE